MRSRPSDTYGRALAGFMANIRIPTSDMSMLDWFEKERNFKPCPGQMKVIQAILDGKHDIDAVAARRSGKSTLAREIALYYLIARSKRVWVLGPTWDIVDRLFRPLWREVVRSNVVIADRQKESRMLRTANGGLLEGVSWAAPEQIEAEGVHVAITDESQLLTRAVRDKIQARLVGDWLWLRIGSPGENGLSFYEEEAFTAEMAKLPHHAGPISWPAWENPDPEVQQAVKIERENLEALKAKNGEDDPIYIQRKKRFDAMYGGISQPPQDVAIGTFNREVHVKKCKFDPDLPVYLAIDPGYYPGFYFVGAFQPHPWGEMLNCSTEKSARYEELWQIDEIYVQREVTDDVIAMCRQREWWKNAELAYIDVAARQTNRQTGKSDQEIWSTATKLAVYSRFIPIADGLNTHRRWLADNRLFHDEDACPNTIREYSLYRMRARIVGDGREVPLDRFNHAMKAIAYMLVQHYGIADTRSNIIEWPRALSRPQRRAFAW